MRRLLIGISAVSALLFGALQAFAAGSGFIEGGHIYTASPGSGTVTYRVSIADPGSAALHNVTVTASEPTHGTSTIKVCAQDASPHCTDDTASIALPAGQSLSFESGSLMGASGSIFSGASVGTVQPGLSSERFVSFVMRRHSPAPPAPVHHPQPTQPSSPAPTPVATSQPTHHRQSQPSHPATQQTRTDIVEPPVNVTVPESTPTETSATTTQTQPQNSSTLGAAGVGNPLVPIFGTAMIAGALALRRSRQRLVGSMLGN